MSRTTPATPAVRRCGTGGLHLRAASRSSRPARATSTPCSRPTPATPLAASSKSRATTTRVAPEVPCRSLQRKARPTGSPSTAPTASREGLPSGFDSGLPTTTSRTQSCSPVRQEASTARTPEPPARSTSRTEATRSGTGGLRLRVGGPPSRPAAARSTRSSRPSRVRSSPICSSSPGTTTAAHPAAGSCSRRQQVSPIAWRCPGTQVPRARSTSPGTGMRRLPSRRTAWTIRRSRERHARGRP